MNIHLEIFVIDLGMCAQEISTLLIIFLPKQIISCSSTKCSREYNLPLAVHLFLSQRQVSFKNGLPNLVHYCLPFISVLSSPLWYFTNLNAP